MAEAVLDLVEKEQGIDLDAMEAYNLLAQGKRNLLCGEIPNAVNQLQEACRVLAAKFGETADECGEAYYTYGKALLDLSRMESGVLGNALQGIEEDDEEKSSEDKSSTDERIEKDDITEEEKEKISEEIIDAMLETDEEAKARLDKDKPKDEKEQENGEKANGEEKMDEEKMDEGEDKKEGEEKMATEKDSEDKGEERSKEESKKDTSDKQDVKTESDKDKTDSDKTESNKKNETGSEKTDSDKKDKTDTESKDKTDTGKKDATDSDKKDKTDSDKGDKIDSDKKDKTETDKKDKTDSDKKDETDSDKKENSDNDKTSKDDKEKNKNEEDKSEHAKEKKEEKNEKAKTEDKKADVTKGDDKKEESEAMETEESKEGETSQEEGEEGEGESEDIADDDTEGDEGDDKEGDTEEDENKEGGSEKKEEEDVSNLQLAWEMLELSKIIYKRNADKETKTKLADTFLKLGEVGLETEQYDTAISDLKECLKLQKELFDAEDRALAETHYQLGLACTFNAEYDEAITNYRSAASSIEAKIGSLKKIVEEADKEGKGKEPANTEDPVVKAQKELRDLEDILPDIMAKIEDVLDEKRSADTVKKMVKDSVAADLTEQTTTGFGPASDKKTDAAPMDITHLVRKKRKPEDDCEDSTKKAKTDTENAAVNGSGDSAAVNGSAEGKAADGPTPVNGTASEVAAS